MIKPANHGSAKHYCSVNSPGSGRVRLPIAPKTQARVRFSPEKPPARALSPEQALNWLDYLVKQGHEIKVINLGGPGDPLATPEITMQVFALLKEHYPKASLCLTSLGLGAVGLAAELSRVGLAHVSILIDAVDPEVAKKIYAWVRPGVKNLPLEQACNLLMAEQASALEAFAAHSIPVLVKTTVYPGVNSRHIDQIACKAAALRAVSMKLFPFAPPSEDCPQPCEELSQGELEGLASLASQHLPTELMSPAYCEEDLLFDADGTEASRAALPAPSQTRPYLAVCSSDGFEVDLHLGQAVQYLIYGPKNGLVSLLETRPAPEPGSGELRWKETALSLGDCFAVLAASAGENPKRLLKEKGLSVLTQEGNLEGMVDSLFGGGKKKGKGAFK